MEDEPKKALEIKETDIVFDCPSCGKSLAIDYRGAGLSIPCADCGKSVMVPIPEGMELSDIDSSSEDKEVIRRRIVRMSDDMLVKKFEAMDFGGKWENIKTEVHKRIIGQDNLIEDLLVALFSKGHCLLIGVPGLAKTLLVHTIGEIAALKFNRIQFTPDMMPMDITGSEILEEDYATGKREFKFIKGPVFAQLILADEINRTPPKTQSALLEAMQERKVSVAGKRYDMEEPFFVLATQNPIEQEGTYPLPEAQLDRFMFCLNVDYTKFEEEVDILLSTTGTSEKVPSQILTASDLIETQLMIREIPVPRSVAEYAVKLVSSTRPLLAPEKLAKYIRWGAGPRASQYLALAGKVHAVLDGRFNVAVEDVKRAAHAVLRHRLVLNFRAEADGLSADDIISELLREIEK